MDSRLLTNLNAQAGSTRDPVIWAKAVCRAASHYAEHGKTQEALRAISIVRAQFGKDLHFDIASWLMLAEGVLHYYKAELPQAYDRMRRAYGLAIALKNISAFPSCAAWMAHLEYNSCQYQLMAQHLQEAAQMARPDDYQAVARYSMVMATSYHIAGEFELSRPWYEKARWNAAAEGDNASISATLYNMAAARASNVRLSETFGGVEKPEIERLKLEYGSSFTYDRIIGIQGLTFFAQMLGGLVHTIDGRYQEALQAFEPININEIPARFAPLVLVDQAWCLINLGEQTAADLAMQDAFERLPHVLEHDDRAYIRSRLCQISDRRGRLEDAKVHGGYAREELEKHRAFQASLVELLRSTNL